MTFTVLHAPLYGPGAKKNPAALRAAIRKHSPDSAGITEGYGVLEELRKMSEYRLVVETGGKDQRRGQKDVPILVRGRLESLGSGQVYGCEPSTPLRIAPERWFTYSVVRTDLGPVFHLCLHPHAVVQDKENGVLLSSARALEFRAQMVRFDALLDWAAAMGWEIVVTGDFNFRDKGASSSSPYRIMRQHGMDYESEGLDGVGWTRRLNMRVTRAERPDSVSNHPWMLARARG
jgi:hypothetical protein